MQKRLSDAAAPQEECVALSMWLTDTNTDQSGPIPLAKDTRGAAATKCHSLKYTVIFILYSAHGRLTALTHISGIRPKLCSHGTI